MNYKYKAKVVAIYDADTITVDIDLGFFMVMRNQRVRLYGINAPEMRGVDKPKGIKSRDWLRGAILNTEVELETFKDKKGKYGRWLATVYKDGVDLNAALVERGLAEVNFY